jgi:hypothetical protein
MTSPFNANDIILSQPHGILTDFNFPTGFSSGFISSTVTILGETNLIGSIPRDPNVRPSIHPYSYFQISTISHRSDATM